MKVNIIILSCEVMYGKFLKNDNDCNDISLVQIEHEEMPIHCYLTRKYENEEQLYKYVHTLSDEWRCQ